MPAPLFTNNPSEFTRLEGVYIFEQNPPAFIRGVSLGTAGIFGQCVKGPVDEPVEITSESRFLEVFGGRDEGAGGAITGQVWKSFLNKRFGKVVVVRAAATAAVSASFTLDDNITGLGTEILRIEASAGTLASPGTWGNNIKFRVVNATNGVANNFNLETKYLGQTVVYENLNISTGVDNTLEVVGDNLATNIKLVKIAAGRPPNTASVTNANHIAALDSDGFLNLGETVADYTSVAGANGTVAASDYTGSGRALDKIKEYRGVAIVACAEEDAALVPTINTAIDIAAASSSDRIFPIWSGDHTDTVSDVVAYAATLNRNDRMILCYNSPYTLDPETATAVQVAPHTFMAGILSQTDVDINPGEEATKQFTSGISRLTQTSLTREDYITLRDAGVAALERDEGFLFVSGVTMDLTPGKSEITRRRSADFLQLSASNRLKFFAKKKNIPAIRRKMGGEINAFSNTLKQQGRVIEQYVVDQESQNTEAQRAQGLEFILWRVKLIGHLLYLVLKTEIGTGVTIEA